MSERLPPLDCVAAFVEAARHLSFKEAGARLGLTTSGISRRIAQLEADLGTALFRRLNRRIELTAAGRAYREQTAPAIEAIHAASARLRRRQSGRRLRLRSLQSFAAIWLLPRLPRFHALHPDIEVEIATSGSHEEPPPGEGEMAIRFGTGPWPGLAGDRLLELTAFPVAAPSLLRERPLAQPKDLARHTLLHARHVPEMWPDWLKGAGVPDLGPAGNRRYDNTQLLYQAAINGLGVAMGIGALIEPALAGGRLSAPFAYRLPLAKSFHLVHRPKDAERLPVKAFRQWLLGEARAASVD